jgi:hypothetical protein
MNNEDLAIKRAEIFRGRQHRLVFLELEENALMVSEIMKKVNSNLKEGKELTIRETSRALKWLAERKYAVCLNPTKKQGVKGIVYKLSNQGKEIKKLEKK